MSFRDGWILFGEASVTVNISEVEQQLGTSSFPSIVIQVIRNPSSSSLNNKYADLTVRKRWKSCRKVSGSIQFEFVILIISSLTGMIVVGHNAFRIVNELHQPMLTLFNRYDLLIVDPFRQVDPIGVSKITTAPRVSSSWIECDESLRWWTLMHTRVKGMFLPAILRRLEHRYLTMQVPSNGVEMPLPLIRHCSAVFE